MDLEDQKDLVDLLDPLVSVDHLVPLENLPDEDALESPDPLVPVDLLVPEESPLKQEALVSPVLTAALACLVLMVNLVLMVHVDLLEIPDYQVHVVPLEAKDPPETLDHEDLKDPVDLLARLVLLALLVPIWSPRSSS